MRAGARNAEKSKAAAFDWVGIEQSLDARGNAVLSRLLNAKQCGEIATRYAESQRRLSPCGPDLWCVEARTSRVSSRERQQPCGVTCFLESQT